MYDELLSYLPIGIERCVGITVLAEMMGISAEKTVRLLRDLESQGLVATTNGAVVNRTCRYGYWYRP